MRQGYALGIIIAVTMMSCGDENPGLEPPLDRLDFPVSAVAHPDGRYVYIANASFERRFREGTLAVYDAWEHRFLDGAAIPIGLFSGEIKLTTHGDDVIAFTTSRAGNSLSQYAIDADPGDSPCHIRLLETYDDFGVRRFAADPYALAVDDDGLMVGHLGSGVVSRWGYQTETPGRLEFQCTLNLPGSVSHLARHPSVERWYVTDRINGQIQIVGIRPFTESSGGVTLGTCQIELLAAINVKSVTTRGLAFSQDGSRLYVASQTDDSVRIYDTSVGYRSLPRNRLVRAIPVGRAPAVIRVAPCQSQSCLDSGSGLPGLPRCCSPGRSSALSGAGPPLRTLSSSPGALPRTTPDSSSC